MSNFGSYCFVAIIPVKNANNGWGLQRTEYMYVAVLQFCIEHKLFLNYYFSKLFNMTYLIFNTAPRSIVLYSDALNDRLESLFNYIKLCEAMLIEI